MADPTQSFLDALANLSTYSGSTAANMAKGLVDQTKLNQAQDQLGLNRANTGVNVGTLGLAQKKFALSAPGELAGQSVRGDVLANSQDATVSGLPSYIHVPTMSGGLRPSMLSASSRALGGQMSRNALADSTSGKYTNLPELPSVPSATPMPNPSALQGLLAKTGMAAGAASAGGGLLDALKKLLGGGAPSASNTTSGASSPAPWQGPVNQGEWQGPTDQPAGSVDTGEFMGQWPEQGGPGSTPVDPSQLPGGSDPMAEYLAWLQSQDGSGGGSETTGTNPWDE